MTLIKSISGIRGTIGGRPGDGLTPLDVVKFVSAFGTWARRRSGQDRPAIVIGRDARISGPMVNQLVVGTLQGLGIDVIDLGLSTTPTVEMAVPGENAVAGIILTASHNPQQWNALKLLNEKGEFISGADGQEVLAMAAAADTEYATVDQLGGYAERTDWIDRHIQAILNLDTVHPEKIGSKKWKVVIDCVNSTGGLALPPLLKALGVDEVITLYGEPTGAFPHNPEPLPEHLTEICEEVVKQGADLGIVVDPDVDRLALVCEDGTLFGEEYTLVAVADYLLQAIGGNTVSNLSSTQALRDITEKAGYEYNASAVGEVNVVELMKRTDAVIGGEGNGGVIFPALHYGRDALVGIALILTHMSEKGMTAKQLRESYPHYIISKNKVALTPDIDMDQLLDAMAERYSDQSQSREDGLKILFEGEWVHMRKSNTEPIIRVYTESQSRERADALAEQFMDELKEVAV